MCGMGSHGQLLPLGMGEAHLRCFPWGGNGTGSWVGCFSMMEPHIYGNPSNPRWGGTPLENMGFSAQDSDRITGTCAGVGTFPEQTYTLIYVVNACT